MLNSNVRLWTEAFIIRSDKCIDLERLDKSNVNYNTIEPLTLCYSLISELKTYAFTEPIRDQERKLYV